MSIILSIRTIRQWLDSRGGRHTGDLEIDEIGLYVLMGNGYGGDKPVYLPEDLEDDR